MTTITLRPITSENWVDCINLSPTPEQVRSSFVAANSLSLAQARYEPWWQPYGIYADEVMVGFVMFGRWPASGVDPHHDNFKPGVAFILRFMIDQRYQGRGYGRAAMAAVIAQIKAQPEAIAIEISYDIANPVMAQLCTRAGFVPTGHVSDGEIEACLASA